MSELPTDLDAAQRQTAEQLLVDRAERTPANQLETLAPQVLAEVAPEHPDLGVESQLAALDAQRKRARARRGLTFLSDGDGSTLIKGSLPTLDAAPLIKLVEAYTESDRRVAAISSIGWPSRARPNNAAPMPCWHWSPNTSRPDGRHR